MLFTAEPMPTTTKFNNLTNQVFGQLKVTQYAGRDRYGSHVWTCVCTCGGNCVVTASNLRRQKSCGCLNSPAECARRATKHGGAFIPEYGAWHRMLQRCSNPKRPDYKHYGARGIEVCLEWRNSFAAFLRDMGPRPSPKHSLERIDNSGDYCKDNCRWATMKEQGNNRRTNHFVTYNGLTLTLSQWEERTGIRQGAIKVRLRRGWSVEDALTKPSRLSRQKRLSQSPS